VSILKSPITLGVEVGALDPSATGRGHIAICYSTNPYGSTNPSVSGGEIAVDLLTGADYTNPSGNTANVACYPDAVPEGVPISCEAGSTPTATISHGPSGTTVDVITVSVPFTVCAGACRVGAVNVGSTGVLVGQLSPVTEPGTGVGYQLSLLQVVVDGVTVVNATPGPTGAFVAPFQAVAESLDFSQGGPCFVGKCVPAGYVETTGSDVAGFQVLGIPFNVAVPKLCLYSNPSGSCP
jgi:hypothetical protein